MPRIVATHAVEDKDRWAGFHSERVEVFSPYGKDVVDHMTPGGDQVAVTVDIHDMDGLMASLQTPAMKEAMDRHGVIQPVTFFVEAV
jgi:hypothetical protein